MFWHSSSHLMEVMFGSTFPNDLSDMFVAMNLQSPLSLRYAAMFVEDNATASCCWRSWAVSPIFVANKPLKGEWMGLNILVMS